jgi:hypothetical protein
MAEQTRSRRNCTLAEQTRSNSPGARFDKTKPTRKTLQSQCLSVYPYAIRAIARVTAAMKAARASGSAAPCGA